MRPRRHRRLDRRGAKREKGPGARENDLRTVERRTERRRVTGVGGAHLIAVGKLLERAPVAPDEAHGKSGATRLRHDEPAGEPGRAENRNRHPGASLPTATRRASDTVGSWR